MSMIAVGVTGAVVGGAASYLGAKEQAKASKKALQYEQAMAQQDEMSAAWTQMLGKFELDKYGKVMKQGNQAVLGHTAKAAEISKAGVGITQQANQQAIQQLAGAEQGAIQQVLNQQSQAMAQTAQQGAAAGFGGSVQAGQSAQVQAMAGQSLANVTGQFGQMKAGMVQQNLQNSMSALAMAAQGEQAMAGAYQQVMDNALTATQEKISLLLATGNSFGLSKDSVKWFQAANDPMYGEMQKMQMIQKMGLDKDKYGQMSTEQFMSDATKGQIEADLQQKYKDYVGKHGYGSPGTWGKMWGQKSKAKKLKKKHASFLKMFDTAAMSYEGAMSALGGMAQYDEVNFAW